MISESDFPDLINLPKEWRNGEEKIQWPRTHDKYNIDWLDVLWRYVNEHHANDLTMLENINIIYSSTHSNSTLSLNRANATTTTPNNTINTNNPQQISLYKLSKNSSLVYTPAFTYLPLKPDTNDPSHVTLDQSNDDTISETIYNALIKILSKLGFTCIESISPQILRHKQFINYVPNLRKSRIQLLKAFKNKYKHASLAKITQDFNALLNDTDIKLIRDYLSKIDTGAIKAENTSLIDTFKDLAIFDNSALEATDRYIPLREALFIYETPIRLPFELAGLKPFICVQDMETRIIIEDKLQLSLTKDFQLILKEIMRYCCNKDANTLNAPKIHSLAKWMLTQCSSLIFTGTNNDLTEFIRTSKLFMNQKQELCSSTQFINPLSHEKYLPLFDPKLLPGKDLLSDEKCLNALKEHLKMRSCVQLRVDELVDLYEASTKQDEGNRRLLAALITEILQNKLAEHSIDKFLTEYSSVKAVTLRHFLMSVDWVPLQRERPQSYPNSLQWMKGSSEQQSHHNHHQHHHQNSKSHSTDTFKFSSAKDCVEPKYAYCAGSVAFISELEMSPELRSKFDFKQVTLELVVRHLKLTTRCFETSALKSEWYDYLTIVKHCYEFMSAYEPHEIYRELKANDLSEWIWNGAGFSSMSSIFIITEKDHPLCAHVAVLPFELYEFVKFFEKIGIKRQPDTKQLEEILSRAIKLSSANQQQQQQQQHHKSKHHHRHSNPTSRESHPNGTDKEASVFENAAKCYPLIAWIKSNYSSDKRLMNMLREYDESLLHLGIATSSNPLSSTSSPIPPPVSQQASSTQAKQPFIVPPPSPSPSTSTTNPLLTLPTDNNPECLYLYLPELYKSADIKENIITSVKTLSKSSQIQILDEESYLARKLAAFASPASSSSSAAAAASATQSLPTNIYDHYRIYNEIILPNLNSLSKNVKDSVVLFALDHADPKMLEILKDHPCIPVQPAGRQLRKPNKLVDPTSRLAALYSDTDCRFPYGSEETYLHRDRVQILKILGMKSESLTWSELVDRAESIHKIREHEAALDRSVALLHLIGDMLASTPHPAVQSRANDEREVAKARAADQLRDIPFIAVKPKPHRLNITWHGEKFKYRFAKPRELLSASYEMLCSTGWPIPLGEHKKHDTLISRHVEAFLGIDDLAAKFSLRDALRQLDEVSKVSVSEIEEPRDLKYVSDMCNQLYGFIESECRKSPAETLATVREFFAERRCILLGEEFINSSQLCWELSVNLRPMFYSMPTSLMRHFKYLFSTVLNIKVHLDLPDLLYVVDSIKKKYKDAAVSLKDDFNILMNVYALIIEQGYHAITNLYLPNVNGVLCLGRTLFMYPSTIEGSIEKAEEFVHPAVDRRVCVIAGVMVKKLSVNGITSVSSSETLNGSSEHTMPSRAFPSRIFGNKRLEGVLARIDHDLIEPKLIQQMDEGNPQMVLEYILEANRVNSYMAATLSDEDITVLLKYFNDFLARQYPHASQFNRLRELKVYRPLWSDKYVSPSTGNVFVISDEMAALIRRAFKSNPFTFTATTNGTTLNSTTNGSITKSASYSSLNGASLTLCLDINTTAPFMVLTRRNELLKLYAHLGFTLLNDIEAFIHLCVPHFRKIDAKSQSSILKYVYDELVEKCFLQEREKLFKCLKERLYIQSAKGDQRLASELYDMKNEALRHILGEGYFADEAFDSVPCMRFLRDAGLRTHLPADVCKACMKEIEERVESPEPNGGWNEDLRVRSKWLYQHLVDNWSKYDESVLQQRFLEPHCPEKRFAKLAMPFEFEQFRKTCIKLSDAELCKHEKLVWSSSYVLPAFVTVDSLDMAAIEFFKLNRVPCLALVTQHLSNLAHTVTKNGLVSTARDSSDVEDNLIEVLVKCYQYLDELNGTHPDNGKDVYKQLEDKEIVWSVSARRFVAPSKVCIDLEASDEIPPFLYTLDTKLHEFRSLFVRLGAKEKPHAMLYGDILRKMAKVCGDDYLNSNEICKGLKAMECFFKYLAAKPAQSSDEINSQTKLAGLYLITTELKLEKSCNVVIIDDRLNLDYIPKLPQEKFLFNPSEKVFKMNGNEVRTLIDKIFVAQRPTLFNQKYEEMYDVSVPDDPASQRQILLTSLERKYQQIFTSRQLHRCLARCISNEEARGAQPKHLLIDEVEKVIRDRLSSIKVTCVEYLETSLSYRRLNNQQKLDQTVEEKACYMVHEAHGHFQTLYLSKKHIEQPYFPLCLARCLQPLFMDLQIDYSILTALIATSVSQMIRLLQLVNVATEENILSVIKLQYVPASGNLYADDVNLLAPFDAKLHNVLPGDLCVFLTAEGVHLYCRVVKVIIESRSSAFRTTSSYGTAYAKDSGHERLEYSFLVQIDEKAAQKIVVQQKDFFVLENWHRIYEAMNSKPPDERESFREASAGAPGSSASSEGRRTPDDNYSDSGDRSDTSSLYDSNEQLAGINQMELEQAKSEVNQELRQLWSLEENERKKKINRLLLKWHPDKNTGRESFASEVFKHLKKQIELYKTDPFLASYYRSPYTSGSYSGFGATGSTSNPSSGSYTAGAGGATGSGATGSTAGDDYKSRHYGSFDDLHRKNGTNGSSAGSTGTGPSMDSDPRGGPSASNLGRSGSFRQEWERRRQQKRHTTGTSDTRSGYRRYRSYSRETFGDRSSPSSRRRGTDFTHMDATLWFTQAKADFDSADNDMHPITGKPAYEWVCYKCYRTVEKALRAYHYYKGNGKLPASDIHGLLLGVETNIRDIAFRFCNFIGNEASAMQYPSVSRFGKTPNEVFPLTKAEQALDYAKELLKLVEEVIYSH